MLFILQATFFSTPKYNYCLISDKSVISRLQEKPKKLNKYQMYFCVLNLPVFSQSIQTQACVQDAQQNPSSLKFLS